MTVVGRFRNLLLESALAECCDMYIFINREKMDKKNDSDTEPVHSLWSQDTEAISNYSEENNLSLEISSSALLLDPEDSDRSGRNVPLTTACSTPHESKLASTSKRKFESSSEDLSPKRRKLLTERVLSPVCVSVALSSASNGTESTNSSYESQTCHDMKPAFIKNPLVVSAEASSSSSSTELVSHKNSESQISSCKKVMLSSVKQSKPSKQKDPEKDPKKETKIKHFTEEFVCTISYIVDEARKDIISLYVREVNRHLCDTKNASNKLSLSSGTLADISGSEGSSVHSGIEKFTVPSKLSVTSTSSSLSSVSSSSSSIASAANRLHSANKFLIPQVSDLKKHLNYRCKGSVCQCFCSKFVNCLLKPLSSPRCLTPETLSSSSENLKTDSQERMDQRHEMMKKAARKDEEKDTATEVTSEATKHPSFSSRSSFYVPTSENLPVFAKWPGNSWFYPGVVENADEDTWHTNKHLEVKFCDGTVRKMLTGNLFPAYFLPSQTNVMLEKDGVCESKIITSVKQLPNNELLFGTESGESIAFQKICFSAAHYKELLKEHSSVLTPRKTPKFSLSIVNVQHGKRVRKVIKTADPSNSSQVKTKYSSSTKKTPSSRKMKGKRLRSTTDSSSTDHTKTEKKIRGSSQKKSQAGVGFEETSTPHHGELGKKEVVRKLYLETPGCSYKQERNNNTNEATSTDPESSGNQNIVFDAISSPNLDIELIPDISRRHLRTKSSKKHTAYHQKNQEFLNKLGPLPETELFSNYNFVLTHSKKKPKPVIKLSDDQSYSEEGTDFEDYYEAQIPFDYLWLREQIISGGGKVYRTLFDVPREEYSNTIVITDNIVETPNYLLAVSLGIPIYRHDLIVNCCTQGKNVAQMKSHAMKMPNGRSLDTGQWLITSAQQPLKGFSCLLCLNVNTSTAKFWNQLITNAGGTVMGGNAIKKILELGSQISFIVGDAALPEDVLNLAESYEIPVVSTVWVVQTIIQGKTRNYKDHKEYSAHYVPPVEDNDEIL